MCTTSPFSKSTRSRPSFQKRNNDGTAARRPVKKVSFSKRDNVLGRAQDYDRTSFEVPLMLRRRRTGGTSSLPRKKTKVAADGEPKPHHANFSGMWRRSHGFNWESLLLFSGVNKAAIAEQVRTVTSHHQAKARVYLLPLPFAFFSGEILTA